MSASPPWLHFLSRISRFHAQISDEVLAIPQSHKSGLFAYKSWLLANITELQVNNLLVSLMISPCTMRSNNAPFRFPNAVLNGMQPNQPGVQPHESVLQVRLSYKYVYRICSEIGTAMEEGRFVVNYALINGTCLQSDVSSLQPDVSFLQSDESSVQPHESVIQVRRISISSCLQNGLRMITQNPQAEEERNPSSNLHCVTLHCVL